MDAGNCATLDYEETRSALFEEIFASKGSSAFQVYWNGFRDFIIGKLSKEEFDDIVHRTLEKEKGLTWLAFNSESEVWLNFDFLLPSFDHFFCSISAQQACDDYAKSHQHECMSAFGIAITVCSRKFERIVCARKLNEHLFDMLLSWILS